MVIFNMAHRSFTVHSAECEDGMPPESMMALTSQTPFLKRFVKTCNNSIAVGTQ